MGARGHDAKDERLLVESRARGFWPHTLAMAKLSGPGWLQSAITLGGGSLASALYLGSLAGYGLLWVQVVAMLLGIVILKAVAEVTLLTGIGPYRAMVDRVNPVLGIAFIGAVLLANVVWCMPQFVLGVSALEQLLLPEWEGLTFRVLASIAMLVLAVLSIALYMRGDRGIRWYENILRLLVGVIVVCFVGVVVSLRQHLPWDAIGRGFVPSLELWLRPAEVYVPYLLGTGNEAFWTAHILNEQRSVLIAAAATAVGINMTFLLPYSMLRKGWNRNYRSLVTFDLCTALL
ncbi:MAG TPA: divalent metal cation transporter, partial [Planctomycetota bacterium]|nr:divalent metal cation transporter [Planctomycetota bacterium]